MVLTDSPGVATGDEFTIESSDTTHTGMTIRSGTSHEGNIFFADSGAGSAGVIRYEHNNDAMVFKTNSQGQEKMRITSGGDVLFNDSTNSIYNDTSGGGMNFKANGQIVTKKQATSQADPLVWLNDTGQTTNRTIALAQDGTERGYLGLTGTSLALGVNGGDRVLITSTGQIGINQTDIDADLHIATAGSSEQDGTLKIGGSENSLGLLFEYDHCLLYTSPSPRDRG